MTVQDALSGLAQPSLLDTQNFTLRRGYRRRDLPLTVSTTPPLEPNGPQLVVIQVKNGVPLRPGIYNLQIESGGIEDVAGNPLAGLYRGVFPTGPGKGGKPGRASFRVRVAVIGRLRHTPQAGPGRFFQRAGPCLRRIEAPISRSRPLKPRRWETRSGISRLI